MWYFFSVHGYECCCHGGWRTRFTKLVDIAFVYLFAQNMFLRIIVLLFHLLWHWSLVDFDWLIYLFSRLVSAILLNICSRKHISSCIWYICFIIIRKNKLLNLLLLLLLLSLIYNCPSQPSSKFWLLTTNEYEVQINMLLSLQVISCKQL